MRHEQEGPVVISRGNGIYFYDENGRDEEARLLPQLAAQRA